MGLSTNTMRGAIRYLPGAGKLAALNRLVLWIDDTTPVYGHHIRPTSAPSGTAAEGDFYFDDTAETLTIHEGTAWRKMPDRLYITSTHWLVADMVDRNFFIADRPLKVLNITYVATTPESAGTLTMIVRRCQGTEAPSAGDALMTAANCVGAALVTQTVYTATLTATTAHLELAAGDRLAVDFTDDTAGELAGLVITVTAEPV